MLAYLTNQYPLPTLSFIRREIAALEAQGIEILRIGLRRWEGTLVDPGDRDEASKTRYVLDGGAFGLALGTAASMLAHPVRFLRALRQALRLGRRSNRGVFLHLVYLAEACVAVRWIRKSGASHVHSHFGTNATTVALLCRVLGGPPYSFTLHGPLEFDEPEALGIGEKVRHAAFAAAISEFTRSQMYRWCDAADWPRIHVVRCGVDRSFLDAPAVPPPAEPRLVCVARLDENKGHLTLIEAAAEVAKTGAKFELVLVGDGPLRPLVGERIAARRLGDQVRITGWQSNAEVRRAMSESRALVLPSFAEGLPVVCMEALAMRRPVLSTFIAGIPELVEPGVCGWLVPAGAVGPLAQAMLEVLRTPAKELLAMGESGARRVEENHDVAKEASKLARLIGVR